MVPERAARLLMFAAQRVWRDAERKFSSTQVDIRGETEKRILEYGLSLPEDQLYITDEEPGRETNVHVTVKYGLHEENVQPVKDLLEGVGPIEITLGRTGMFESEKYDVLYIQVESEDLHRLNAYISDTLEVTDTHPKYTPHCTVAYMKKGCAVHYLGDDRFDGIILGLDTVTFGSKNGKDTTFRVAEASMSDLHHDWRDAEDGIARVFTFEDRRKLASFVASVANHANTVNHHPDIKTEGDSARVSYCTHQQGDSVTALDFESARVVDLLAKTYGVLETKRTHRAARGENSLHKAADKNLPVMREHLLKAFTAAKKSVNKPRLRAALMTKNRKLARSAVAQVPSILEKYISTSVPEILADTLRLGGEAGAKMIRKPRAAAKKEDPTVEVDWGFDPENEDAAKWVEENGAQLGTSVSQTTQDEIDAALQDAFEGGDLDEAIDQIVAAVGDEERGDLIARTELMRASNEGQRQAWSQAVDAGVLTGDERKEWVTTEVGACDECDALDGEITDLDGQYSGEGGDGPPLHPRCRCTEGIVYSEPKALGGKGSGNFGHGGRPGERGGSSEEATDREKSVLRDWVGQPENESEAFAGGGGLNHFLRDREFESTDKPEYEKRVKELSNLIERHPTSEDKVMYRSVPTSVVKQLESGEVVPDKGFISLTTDREFASGMASNTHTEREVLEVRVPKGTPLLDVQKILGSSYTSESEHLLSPNTSFRLKKEGEKRVLEVVKKRTLGGVGSGNFGHEGRPGEKGGSSPAASISSILSGEKVGEALGTNPGGVYRSKSGEKWYVKEYKTKEQAYGEQLSNALYHEVGVGAPQSLVEEKDGKTYYASKWLPNSEGILQDVGLNKKNADAVLDGFAADAFLANWDAVGTGLDNIMVHHGGDVSRVDSGGSLLHRAQGALKPESVLNEVGEWKTLSDPVKAPYYSKVFKKAGVENADALGSRAVDQIDSILKVGEKSGGWKGFVETHIPKAPKEYKERVSSMLEARSGSLRSIRTRVAALKDAGGAGSGNFGHEGRPGEVGGSTEGGGAGESASSAASKGTGKGKHDAEKVQLALKMKADGATLSAIQKATGLHPSTTNYYTSKMKAKEAALKGEFIAKPKPSTPSSYYWKKNTETGKYEKTLTSYGKEQQKKNDVEAKKLADEIDAKVASSDPYGIGKQFAEKDKLSELTEELKKTNAEETTKFEEPSSGATLQTANSLTEVATKYGYEWKVKTSGPQAGKYAWFQNGIQVSAPHAESDKEIAAASMHFNTGPKTPQVESHAQEWPIGKDVERTLNPAHVQTKYNPWVSSLTEKQRAAIESYTGTAYGDINTQLRAGKSFDEMSVYMKSKAKSIQEAIDKAPNPPPPDLVWRGLGILGANSFVSKLGVGDEIEMKGFQSTTINPLIAQAWAHVESTPILEIKPSKGAYVQSISQHKTEREFILPHGAKYRVKGLASIRIAGSYGPNRKVLQLEMI